MANPDIASGSVVAPSGVHQFFGEYLSTSQLKAYTGRSAHRFKIDRMLKQGCPYIRLNGRIYYRRRDLDEYMAAHLVHPTDNPKAA